MCNKEQLVSYVYEELAGHERAEFEQHLSACAECQEELADLRGTRFQLASWAPPQPEFNFHIVRGAAAPAAPVPLQAPPRRRLAFVPQWALSAAAALLLVAGAAAVANLDVRYGQEGLVVRTGWMKAPPPAVASPAIPAGATTPAVPVSASSEQMKRIEQLSTRLQELEQAYTAQLARVSSPTRASITVPELRRILEELESRQRTEMALQVAQVWKDFNAARVTDYTRMQDVVSRAQGVTNQQLRQHRDSIETLYRTASQR
jgi:anti-sigma factor RsiW